MLRGLPTVGESGHDGVNTGEGRVLRKLSATVVESRPRLLSRLALVEEVSRTRDALGVPQDTTREGGARRHLGGRRPPAGEGLRPLIGSRPRP